MGSILVFLDADCIVGKKWLENLTKPLILEGAFAAYGGSTDVEQTRWSSMEHRYEESTVEGYSKGGYTQMGDTKNLAVRKNVFEKLGGFDELFRFSGDTDFGLRLIDAGYKIRYVSGSEVQHHFKATLRRIIRDKFRHGFWGVKVYARHKKHLVIYGRVLHEVKLSAIFLLASILFFSAGIVITTGLATAFKLISTISTISSVFMLIGANHTTVPIIKHGLTDYNVYGLIHSAAWRCGALWYVLKNPKVWGKI